MSSRKKISLILLTLFSVSNSFSQELKKHQWKNRLVVVVTNDIKSKEYVDQINILKKELSELEERKIMVYSILPKKYTSGLLNKEWISSTKVYNRLNKKKESFKVFLIGLDGGIKLNQSSVLTKDKLFTLIDGMPMRRQELKNKLKNFN